jgi:hypothetical protein
VIKDMPNGWFGKKVVRSTMGKDICNWFVEKV